MIPAIQGFLVNAVVRCHKTILADLQTDRSMTNLVTAVRVRDSVIWAFVSDAFLLRQRGKKLEQINRDLGQGVRGRRFSIWLGDRHFQRRYIDSGQLQIDAGDTFVLATDGLMKHPTQSPEAFLKVPIPPGSVGDLCRDMAREFALKGRDNLAIALFQGRGET